MSPLMRHGIIPAIAPTLFFVIAATPVEVIGCRNRGLAAVIIALISVLGALGTAIAAVAGRHRGDPSSWTWVLTTLILAVPAVALLVLA